VVLSITTSSGEGSEFFRRALGVHEELAHVTVEVERVPVSSQIAQS
jgi:hypothetical protein